MMDQISSVSHPAVLSDLQRTLVSRKVGSMPKMDGPKIKQPKIRTSVKPYKQF